MTSLLSGSTIIRNGKLTAEGIYHGGTFLMKRDSDEQKKEIINEMKKSGLFD